MNLHKSVILVLLCLVSATFVLAFEKVDLRQDNKLVLKMQDVRARQALSHQELLANVAGMSENMSLELVRKVSDSRDMSHYRYRVMYRGVPVWGEQVIISEDANKNVVCMHGFMVSGLEREVEDMEAAYDAETALNVAKSLHKVTEERDTVVYENETSELVVYLGEKAQLSYAVTFFADVEQGGKPTRPTYILDAKTKDIIHTFEGLTNEKKGTGPGGNEKTGKYQYGKDYPAFDVTFADGKSTMNNTGVKTINLNHGSSGSTAYTYEGTENTVKTINGAYSPLNDAHYFGGIVIDLYKQYNTAPLTFQLVLKVHYSNSYENAFWNGSSMTFGDGKTRFFPLVSLDVVTHEVSHGFTEQNSGLIYSAQSGGINEAFSDIAGEAAKYFMKGTNDWMVGADIFKSTGALRYFKNPPQDGKSIGSANDYKNGMDVHYSSGVFNKAFYLLAATNGWNTKKAFDVYIKANQKYWTSNATFVTAAKGVLDAAKDYKYNLDDVVTSFRGVDVTITAD